MPLIDIFQTDLPIDAEYKDEDGLPSGDFYHLKMPHLGFQMVVIPLVQVLVL